MATTASAHRFAPSLLELEQLPDAIVSVQWRRPLQADPSVSPVLPDACSVMDQPQSRIDSGAIVMRWHLRCPEDQARVVSVQGLDQSRTAALVRWRDLRGAEREQLLRDSNDVFVIGPAATQNTGRYLLWGVEHILVGADHLLFVLGLLLLAQSRRRLFWWISGFTLGHSITLSLASVGLLWTPPEATEFLIAASIVVLALSIPGGVTGGRVPAARPPRYFGALVPLFGLLHGLGFASVLRDLGLPEEGLLSALLAFNLGIELGQIVFVLAIYLLHRLLISVLDGIASPGLRAAPRWLTIYTMGGVSVYWCLDRGLTVLEATLSGPYGLVLFS